MRVSVARRVMRPDQQRFAGGERGCVATCYAQRMTHPTESRRAPARLWRPIRRHRWDRVLEGARAVPRGQGELTMDRITRVRIRNVRAIVSLDLELTQPITVLIGENGSGKSTILECLELLRRAADPNFTTST